MMVSARKVKARLDKSKLTELKKKNTEKQAELALSVEEAQAFSDELVKSAIAGFESELQKSSPAMKQLAANLSGMIQEFFIGFKQGVDAELNTFIKDTGKSLAKSVSSMDTAVAENVQKISEDLKEPIQDLAEEVKETRKEREKVTKEQKTEMIISDVLKRPNSPEAAKTVLGKKGNVKDWLTRAGLGAIGMEEEAERVVGQRQQKEAFVQIESKLRAKEFEGMDPKEVRKTLEEQFKVISETTEKIREVEKEIGAYKDLGYSDEQIKQLGVGSEKQALTEKLIAADPSRMEKYKEVTVKEQLEKKESSSVLEETILEQARLDEEAAKKQEQQNTLLTEIRDILKEQQKETSTKAAAAPAGAGDGSPSLPDIDIDLPGRRTPTGKAPRGSILKNVGRSVMKVARFAGPAALAGAAVLGGVNLVDAGLGKLGVGKDAEGKDIELDQAQDDANWEKMSTGGKIMSGAARGIEKVGSFLGLDNISRAAAANRIKSETEYLKSKEATVQDVKKATSEMQQNKVEEQAELSQQPPVTTTPAEMQSPGSTTPEKKGLMSRVFDRTRTFFSGEKPNMVQPNMVEVQERRANLRRVVGPSTPEIDAAAPIAVDSEMVASPTVEAPTETFSSQPVRLAKTETGEFVPVPTEDMGMSNQPFNTDVDMNNTRSPRTRSQRVPIDDGGVIAAEGRKVRRKIDSEVSQSTRNLPGFARAEIRSRTEKLGSILTNPRELISNFESKTRSLPSGVSEPPSDSMVEAAQAMAKNIVVQAPAPVVVPAPAPQTQMATAPFNTNIRNDEPSISDYLRSRYAY